VLVSSGAVVGIITWTWGGTRATGEGLGLKYCNCTTLAVQILCVHGITVYMAEVQPRRKCDHTPLSTI
jgi:hypothetical protein